ncbi:hypothetical protein SUGI_1081720 [Cryptomeria japonica]|nr:hypothetical protein SUGI_1081720 [Cryptomeria japonica]
MLNHFGVSFLCREESIQAQCSRLFQENDVLWNAVWRVANGILGANRHWCDGFVYEAVICPMVDIFDSKEATIQRIDGFICPSDGQALGNAILELDSDCWVSTLHIYFNHTNYISSKLEESNTEDEEIAQKRVAWERRENFIQEAWEVFRVGVRNGNLDPFCRLLNSDDNWLSAPTTVKECLGSILLQFFSVATLNKMEEYAPPTTKIPFQSDKEYHVFLSFRGEDVRKNLVDHLYQALTAAGLHVYKDDDKLEKGDLIWPSLERAIESSAVLIPVFSRGYAESTWCLNEAATMVKTKGFIIPLFYCVGPTHVRYPLGNSIRYPREEIDGWKDALEKICSRSGWSMDLTGGFEAQLVKTVVNDVIKTLDKVPLEVAKHPVGLESVTDDLIQKFKLNSKEDEVCLDEYSRNRIVEMAELHALRTILQRDVVQKLHASFTSHVFSLIQNLTQTLYQKPKLKKIHRLHLIVVLQLLKRCLHSWTLSCPTPIWSKTVWRNVKDDNWDSSQCFPVSITVDSECTYWHESISEDSSKQGIDFPTKDR